MQLYGTKKQSQVALKKVFSLGESLPSSQDPRVSLQTVAEDCSSEQSSALLTANSLEEKKKKLGNSLLPSLSANSSEFPNSEELELDINYISRHSSTQIRSHQYISLYCSRCGYRYTAPVKCENWRLCDHCKKRESFRLSKKYLKMINSVPREKLRLITVTIPNAEKLTRQTIQKIRSYWIKLLHLKRYEQSIVGGFYSIEVINRGRGWNIHLHAICEVREQSMLPGSFKKQRATEAEKQLRIDWIEVTGHTAEIVDISNVSSPGGALRYILKDLLKSAGLTSIRATEYLRALKASRLLSLFGKWYAKVKEVVTTARFKCPNCKNEVWIDQYFLRDIEQELNPARAP